MAEHNEFGKAGEEMAARWLVTNGYEIWHCNWRYSYFEIDIIARKDKKLHFIEVKTRRHSDGGYPEDSVTKKKFKRLQQASNEFLQQNPGYPWIQYDILSITWRDNNEPEFFLINDVFY